MANPTVEEHLDNPTNTQSENPPDEIIPATNTENIKPNQEIENMEVHHHAHHEGKKSWKSYAWEFLMLFLAVFCGFLAEYFLEHRVERERGNQYLQSMIEDMVSDSIKINQSLEFCKNQKLGLDSLSVLFNNPPYTDINIQNEYLLMSKYTLSLGTVSFTKRTVSQLRNSGGMRLIPNKISADEVTKYSEIVDIVESQGNFFRDIALNETLKLSKKIFYFKYLKEIDQKGISSSMIAAPIELANEDRNLLLEYSNQLIFSSALLDTYISMLTDLKSEIPKTIEILKKENYIK